MTIEGSIAAGRLAPGALDALLDATATFASAASAAAAIEAGIEELQRHARGLEVFVGVLDRAGGDVLAASRMTPGWPVRLRAGDSLAGSILEVALERGRPASLDCAGGRVRLVPGLPVPGSRPQKLRCLVGAWRAGAGLAEGEMRLFDAFAHRLANAVGDAELREETALARARLKAGLDMALDVAELDEQSAVRRLLQRAVGLAGGDRGIVFRVRGGELVTQDAHGYSFGTLRRGERIPLTTPFIGAAATNRRPVVFGHADRRALPEPVRRSLSGLRHVMAVPALVAGGVEAVILIGRRADPEFADGDIEMVQQVGGVAALALHSTRLLEEARASRVVAEQTAAMLRTAVDVAEDLAATLDPREVGRRLLEHAAAVVRADRAVLCHVAGTRLVVEGSYPDEAAAHATAHEFPAEGFIAESIASRQPTLGGGASTGDGLVPVDLSIAGRYRQGLSVPLVLNNELTGLFILWRARNEHFRDEEITTTQMLGNVAALALHNARLFAAAESASNAKSTFLNMAAHELRTPLTVIRGYISMLADGGLRDSRELEESIFPILSGKAQELEHMVEGILAAARLEGESSRLAAVRELDVAACVRAAVERLSGRAALLDADVEVDMGAAPLPALGVEESTARILDNLLNNALTYSKGRPWVKVTAVRDGARIRVSVADHGVGIPDGLQAAIFERLVRVDNPELGYPAGTGLGLFISRGLAEKMGGSLRLGASRPGEGSEFVLELRAAARPKGAKS